MQSPNVGFQEAVVQRLVCCQMPELDQVDIQQIHAGPDSPDRVELSQTRNGSIAARGRPLSFHRMDNVIGSQKRRGPAAPGFSHKIELETAMLGLCELPEPHDIPARSLRISFSTDRTRRCMASSQRITPMGRSTT